MDSNRPPLRLNCGVACIWLPALDGRAPSLSKTAGLISQWLQTAATVHVKSSEAEGEAFGGRRDLP
jgi:hypothetical protein